MVLILVQVQCGQFCSRYLAKQKFSLHMTFLAWSELEEGIKPPNLLFKKKKMLYLRLFFIMLTQNAESTDRNSMSPISVKDRKSNTRREKHERLLYITQRRMLWRTGMVEVNIYPVNFLVRKIVHMLCLCFVHNCVCVCGIYLQ